MKIFTLLCFTLLITITSYGVPLPKIIYVDADLATGSFNGTDWSNAYTSLQDALDDAISGDQIWVAGGTYIPSLRYNLTVERTECFQMKEGVEIYGSFAGTETDINERDQTVIDANPSILDGDIGTPGDNSDNSYHVVYSEYLTNAAVLDGFTIRNGNANNASSYGGGLYNMSSSPVIRSCNFIDNNGTNGGGMCNDNATPLIIFCGFVNNTSVKGGGICNIASSPDIFNCGFFQNAASSGTQGGGAIYNGSVSEPLIKDCYFLSNTSVRRGGGIFNHSSAPTIINCVFNGNLASTYGGGICNYNASTAVITNCTFTSNSAPSGCGGGIFDDNSTSSLLNTILWGNFVTGSPATASELEATYDLTGTPASFRYCCIRNGSGVFTGAGNIFTNPSFVDADGVDDILGNQDDDLNLQYGSLCIDAGTSSGAPLQDITGNWRGLGICIGAYEENTDDPMPVEISSFSASNHSNGVELKWETATEYDNYGFDIQRSVRNANSTIDTVWEKIGFVAGAVNSDSPKKYSFIDENPVVGNVQYRLKQISSDGSFVFDVNIVEIYYSITDVNGRNMRVPTEYALDQNYPNPFNPTTRIQYAVGSGSVGNNTQSIEQLVTLRVYDILGNEVATLVNEHKAPGYYEVEFDGSNLSTGVYVYKLTAGSFTSTKKLMLMK